LNIHPLSIGHYLVDILACKGTNNYRVWLYELL